MTVYVEDYTGPFADPGANDPDEDAGHDCGKGEWCPQFGRAFKRAQQKADERWHANAIRDEGVAG